MIKGVFLDLAGFVCDGDHAIAGAADAVGRLRGAGIAMRFISNPTRSTGQTIMARSQ